MEIILGRSEIDSKKRIEFTILFIATCILQTLEKKEKELSVSSGGEIQVSVQRLFPNPQSLQFELLWPKFQQCGGERTVMVCVLWPRPSRRQHKNVLELGNVGVMPRVKPGLFRIEFPVSLICRYVWWLSSRIIWGVYSTREPFWSIKYASRWFQKYLSGLFKPVFSIILLI